MGWLTMPLALMGVHRTPKAYLDAQFTYERTTVDGSRRALRVIASSTPRNQVYYAAAQPSDDGVPGPVFAVICKVRWSPGNRHGEAFGYKDMTEHSGPTEADCPARILALLGPTLDEFALDWRRRCFRTLNARARDLPDGAIIRFAEPLTFGNGAITRDTFKVSRTGRSIVLRDESGQQYRVPKLMDRPWSLVHQTKVHAPAFPPRGN